MSAESFNSLGGFSVGIPEKIVVDANGNVVTNVMVPSGNVVANTVSANTLNITGNIALGDVSNVSILGGENGYFLQTDGDGNLTWAAGGNGGASNAAPAGSNTQVQFNDAGSFGGNAGFTFNKITGTLNIGNIVTGSNVTANIVSANYLYGDGSNITGITGFNNCICFKISAPL